MRFVDSNIFIYVLANDPRYGDTSLKILRRIEKGEEAAISTLVITQVCSYLRWRKRVDIIPTFLKLIRSLVTLRKIQTSFEDFILASKLIEKYNLDWGMWDDLVITVQMQRYKINEIYSNDKDFDRIPGVKRIFK